MSSETIWTTLAGTGTQERFYDVAGVRTRVLEAGSGPALVLLHGTGGHAETYYRNLGPLSEHFHVLAVDMLGHGFTDLIDGDYTLDAYAAHIEGLLDVVGVERAHVSGESLGAAVAEWFAVTRPDRVDRIVLNTGILIPPDRPSELADLGARTRAIMADGLTREAVRHRMEWLVSEPERMTAELVDIRYRIYTQPGRMEATGKIMTWMMGMLLAGAHPEYLDSDAGSRVRCPALVIWTEHNPGQSVELARAAAARIPDSRFEVVEDCGHWPQFEQADRINELFIEFLGATQPA